MTWKLMWFRHRIRQLEREQRRIEAQQRTLKAKAARLRQDMTRAYDTHCDGRVA